MCVWFMSPCVPSAAGPCTLRSPDSPWTRPASPSDPQPPREKRKTHRQKLFQMFLNGVHGDGHTPSTQLNWLWLVDSQRNPGWAVYLLSLLHSLFWTHHHLKTHGRVTEQPTSLNSRYMFVTLTFIFCFSHLFQLFGTSHWQNNFLIVCHISLNTFMIRVLAATCCHDNCGRFPYSRGGDAMTFLFF